VTLAMAKSEDGTGILLLLAGIFILRQLMPDQLAKANKTLQNAGSKAYEATHPDQAAHADDLPGKAWTKSQLVALARDTGFPDPNTAAAVALAESGGYPGALGDDGNSVGLWQIHMPSHPSYSKTDLRDPRKNARAAFSISKAGSTWRWWSAYRSGAYRKYL